MPNRSRKQTGRDFNQIARSVVDQATGAVPPKKKPPRPVKKADAVAVEQAESEGMAQPQGLKPKIPAAVALGRKGGKKGGPARAAKMTKEQRSASAKKAAQSRWQKKS